MLVWSLTFYTKSPMLSFFFYCCTSNDNLSTLPSRGGLGGDAHTVDSPYGESRWRVSWRAEWEHAQPCGLTETSRTVSLPMVGQGGEFRSATQTSRGGQKTGCAPQRALLVKKYRPGVTEVSRKGAGAGGAGRVGAVHASNIVLIFILISIIRAFAPCFHGPRVIN